MFTDIIAKLPMRQKELTSAFYKKLGFTVFGNEFDHYLMLQKDNLQLHFFEFKNLVPDENYGQIYIRTTSIENLYNTFIENKVPIHPNGNLAEKPWGQKEFSILDPDNNLITFGETLN
ncbi:Bleomycin resistance protein [Chryseobacterium sp. FH2]|uniref:bleomycin resistance protein n=1 Tax=Chryseobacterium sp. FH2 TaxID=1674291 RepID=UPI00065AA11C|nr:VOC family protein [Chryseobacterium sp. FH2]KMQ65276.1 Bleomycin resistance protein [Chryseobacterium sp. FH2]